MSFGRLIEADTQNAEGSYLKHASTPCCARPPWPMATGQASLAALTELRYSDVKRKTSNLIILNLGVLTSLCRIKRSLLPLLSISPFQANAPTLEKGGELHTSRFERTNEEGQYDLSPGAVTWQNIDAFGSCNVPDLDIRDWGRMWIF